METEPISQVYSLFWYGLLIIHISYCILSNSYQLLISSVCINSMKKTHHISTGLDVVLNIRTSSVMPLSDYSGHNSMNFHDSSHSTVLFLLTFNTYLSNSDLVLCDAYQIDIYSFRPSKTLQPYHRSLLPVYP